MNALINHSLESLQQQAIAGEAQAQFDLAYYYACENKAGDHEQNGKIASMWLKQAAEQGLADAHLTLLLYLIVQCDSLNLHAWLKQSFEPNVISKGFDTVIELITHTRIDFPKHSNREEDLISIKKETEKNSNLTPALLVLFNSYQWKLTTWLEQSFEPSAIRKAVSLSGHLLFAFEDKDIDKHLNSEAAFAWIKKASEQGSAPAQFCLAACYSDGLCVEANKELAFHWVHKSVEQDFAGAYHPLALCYYLGKGVEQNVELAFYWLSKAVEHIETFFSDLEFIGRHNGDNLAEAYLLLSDMYAEGKGVEQNNELALMWFTKGEKIASEYANANIKYRLARKYLAENQSEERKQKGLQSLMEAAIANHTPSIQWIESTYIQLVFPYFMDREDSEECFTFAHHWLTEKFNKNPSDFEVDFGLGGLYVFGKGVVKNQKRAIEYFEACKKELNDEFPPENDFASLVYDFSDMLIDITNGSAKNIVTLERLAPLFYIKPEKHENSKHNLVILPKLTVDFLLQKNETQKLKEFLNSFADSESRYSAPYKEGFIEIGIKAANLTEELIKKNQALEEKNKKIQEAEQEMEDMMAMFTHKFRSPLDAIIYNTTHGNQEKLYTEAAQTMRGLLDVFSIISTDEAILKSKLRQDNRGNSNLMAVFSKTLDMILLHLLSVSGTEKIQQHYLEYAKAHKLCDPQISYKLWNEEYFELERQLQTEWELSYAQLLSQSASLEQCLDWLEQHFFKLKLHGFDSANIQFKEYSITESFLTILLNEILVNTFKYYSSADRQAVMLEWTERDGYQWLSCHNPSVRAERSKQKGSGKGHVFLSALARKTGSQFNKPKPNDDFVLEFGVANELLKDN